MKFWRQIALLLSAITLGLVSCAAMLGGSGPVNVASLTPTQWANLNLKAEVLKVEIRGQPVVTFKVTDQAGNPVTGLGRTVKRATDQFASYPNVSFTLAKLVPGYEGRPSKWVNYMVTTVPTVANPAPSVGRFPGTDNTGTLVEQGSGVYTYTFWRDVTKVKDVIAATVDTDKYRKADLGDLSFDPNLTHRLAFQISGAAPGTGTNVPTGVADPKVPAVNIKQPLNVVYDFVPATGKVSPNADYHRDITPTSSCNACHGALNKLGFHGGSRYEVKYCVACHTDQVKVGAVEATRTPDGKGFTGVTDKIDNRSPGEFTTMVHKLHMGRDLTLTGYNWLNRREGQFNLNGYPQKPSNCLSCHTTDKALAPQADNWKNVPSRTACGSCHDGIDWVTNKGPTVHPEGPQADDTQCASCHEAADIAKVHGY